MLNVQVSIPHEGILYMVCCNDHFSKMYLSRLNRDLKRRKEEEQDLYEMLLRKEKPSLPFKDSNIEIYIY